MSNRKLGESYYLTGSNNNTSSITRQDVEQIADDLDSKRIENDFFASLTVGNPITIQSTDQVDASGFLISFNTVALDKGKFWQDATPSTYTGMKQKIRVDNKPEYKSGFYYLAGNIYCAKNPVGKRILHIGAQIFYPKGGYTISNRAIWTEVKLATNDEIPITIERENARFDCDEVKLLAQDGYKKATGVTIPLDDLNVYVYLSLIQNSGVPLTVETAEIKFKKLRNL